MFCCSRNVGWFWLFLEDYFNISLGWIVEGLRQIVAEFCGVAGEAGIAWVPGAEEVTGVAGVAGVACVAGSAWEAGAASIS